MLGCGAKPLLPPDDVCDPHQVIVNDVREVICWVAVALYEHLVIKDMVLEDDLAMDHVSPFTRAMGHEHANDGRFPAGEALLDFGGAQVEAEAIVFGRLMLFSALLKA
jgi:hypothetical protein